MPSTQSLEDLALVVVVALDVEEVPPLHRQLTDQHGTHHELLPPSSFHRCSDQAAPLAEGSSNQLLLFSLRTPFKSVGTADAWQLDLQHVLGVHGSMQSPTRCLAVAVCWVSACIAQFLLRTSIVLLARLVEASVLILIQQVQAVQRASGNTQETFKKVRLTKAVEALP